MEIQCIFINEDVISYILNILPNDSLVKTLCVCKKLNNTYSQRYLKYKELCLKVIDLAKYYSNDGMVLKFTLYFNYKILQNLNMIFDSLKSSLYLDKRIGDNFIWLLTSSNNIIKIIEQVLLLCHLGSDIFNICLTKPDNSYLEYDIFENILI